jgi:hypothetical protein
MRFLATGRTSERLQAQADDPRMTERVAALAGITPLEAENLMRATAVAIKVIEAEGLTPEKCYFLCGLDKTFGPWTGAPVLAA